MDLWTATHGHYSEHFSCMPAHFRRRRRVPEGKGTSETTARSPRPHPVSGTIGVSRWSRASTLQGTPHPNLHQQAHRGGPQLSLLQLSPRSRRTSWSISVCFSASYPRGKPNRRQSKTGSPADWSHPLPPRRTNTTKSHPITIRAPTHQAINSTMAATATIDVPHLGGIKAGYALSGGVYDPSKPTCVLINSMCTTVSLYRSQFSDPALTGALNLLAIEPLGHGATSCAREHFTYWDTAVMALQVMDKLGVDKAFALGTSQGGWMVARMALLAPERIQGLVLLGTSMDYESADSRSKGCWDPKTLLEPFYEKWCSSVPTPEFVVDDVWCGMVASLGFGAGGTAEMVAFWTETLKGVYTGDEGRKKLKMALACLLDRDGLCRRGTEDAPFSTTVPAEQIKLFTSSKEATLTMIEGGHHYLNATNPKEVGASLLQMVNKYK
ncbi:Alpha/Beta hydrolase protein [Chaetomium tenue]|uniref:Alpha/Beta hydrolase protein n=1 Tax=Chaetomium tenue TaxID=1854479 RepID=A0ACB7P619_9PEZI|nr:Alpha/Beta hydrolase protein [Chaetomium globosum]